MTNHPNDNIHHEIQNRHSNRDFKLRAGDPAIMLAQDNIGLNQILKFRTNAC